MLKFFNFKYYLYNIHKTTIVPILMDIFTELIAMHYRIAYSAKDTNGFIRHSPGSS